MKRVDTSQCLAHVVVCVNQRRDSKLPCCAEADRAQKLYARLQSWIQKHHLSTRIWLTKTDCLGWCHRDGVTVAIYPHDIWYRAVCPDDCRALIERHLQPLVENTEI